MRLNALPVLQAKEGDGTVKKTDGTEGHDSSQEGHKGMEGKQKDGSKPGNTAAGSSDAEFEKLLAEVHSTLSLLLASDVSRAPLLLGKLSMLACTDLHCAPTASVSIFFSRRDQTSVPDISPQGYKSLPQNLLLSNSCCVSLQCI